MKRPLVVLAIVYILGILTGRYLFHPDIGAVSIVFAALIALSMPLAIVTNKSEWHFILPFFAIGIFMVNLHNISIFDELDGRKITLSGIIKEIRTTDYGYETITIKADGIAVDDVRIQYNKKINVHFKEPQNAEAGQPATATGIAEKLDFVRNPGGFSEELYMKTRGFGGKLTKAELTTGPLIEGLGHKIEGFSSLIASAFEKQLPPEMSSLMQAIVLGERNDSDNEVYAAFQKTGTAHILSISGMHLSFITFFIFFIFRRIGLRFRMSSFATIAVIIFYCVFTGASISTLRATLMLSIVLAGNIIYKSADIYTSAALTAFVILLWQPLFLWDAGFLLSFSAVLGIAFISPIIEPIIRGLVKNARLSYYISATISATLVTMPVCAYFFHYVSLSSIFANLLIVPFTGLLVGAGFVFIFVFSLPISVFVSAVIFTLLKYFIEIVTFFSELPFSYVIIGAPKIYNILIFYALLILAFTYISFRTDSANEEVFAIYERRLKAAICALAAFAAIINIRAFFPEKKLEIVFLDVKQGDAAVLHLPDNVNIVIDAGGSLMSEIGDNTGKRVVSPYLLSKGIKSINAIFLSHPDIDHAAGVIELMELTEVNRLFISDINFESDAVLDLVLETARKNNIPVTKIKRGYFADIGETRIECLYPNYSGTPREANNGSMVLKVIYGSKSFLFTGDIEQVDEDKIVKLSGASEIDMSLKSDILKVAHHGSNSSSSEPFVKMASPTAAIAGAGKDNVFGHPSKETVDVFRDNYIPLLTTASEGAIKIETDGEALIITTNREASK